MSQLQISVQQGGLHKGHKFYITVRYKTMQHRYFEQEAPIVSPG